MATPAPTRPFSGEEAKRRLAELRKSYPEVWRLRGTGEPGAVEREMLKLEEIIQRDTLESLTEQGRGQKPIPGEAKTDPACQAI